MDGMLMKNIISISTRSKYLTIWRHVLKHALPSSLYRTVTLSPLLLPSPLSASRQGIKSVVTLYTDF